MFDSTCTPIFSVGVHVLFMLFVFIYAYWCPALFQYHMLLLLSTSIPMRVTS